MAARFEDRVLPDGPLSRVRRADRRVPERARAEVPEIAGGDDRALQSGQRATRGRRGAESEPLDVVQARVRERDADRLPLQGDARLRPAAGSRDRRRNIRGETAQRDRISHVVAPPRAD